jgi:ParB family chromosome partitioning protein
MTAQAKITVPPLSFKTELTPAALAATTKTTGASKQGSSLMVPIDQIKVLPDFNVRVRDTDDYKAGIAELVGLIKANGYYQHKPLAGYAAKEGDTEVIYLEDGHRRLEAVQALNFELPADQQIKQLPVVVAPQATTMEDMLVNLVVSNTGKDLIPYEKGIVVKRLLNVGMSKADIAARLQYTPRYIDDLLVLVGASAAVRNLMLSGRVSSTQALRELRKDAGKAADVLTAAVKSAEAKGKTRATAKDKAATGPKMQKIEVQVNFAAGDIMGSTLKVLAGQLRQHVPHDAGESDAIQVDGTITVILSIPAPVQAAPEPAKAPEAAPAAAAAAPAAEAAPAAPKKARGGGRKGKGKGAAAAAAAPADDPAKRTAEAAVAAGLVPAPAGDDPLAHALGGGGEAPAADAPKADDGLADL